MKKIKLQYKILILIFLFFTLLIFNNNKSEAYVYDISETVNKKDCKYVVYLAQDDNFYLALNYQENLLSPSFYYAYLPDINVIHPASNSYYNGLRTNYIYLLKEGLITFVGSFVKEDLYTSSYEPYKVKEIYYSNKDIYYHSNFPNDIYLCQKSVPDVTALEIQDDFTLQIYPAEPEYRPSIDTPENSDPYAFYLRTQLFPWAFYRTYQIWYAYEDSTNFERYFDIRAVENNDFTAENLKFCFLFKPTEYGTYYFRLYNTDTGKFSNTVTFEFTDSILSGTHLVGPSVLPVPELALLNTSEEVYVVTQWLSKSDFSELQLYYRNTDNPIIKTDYFIKSNAEIETSDYDNTLFRFKFPIEYTGTYDFAFVRGNERSADNSIYVDIFNLGDNELETTGIFDSSIPTLSISELDYFSYEEIFGYSQWFNEHDIQYLIYYRNKDMSDFEEFTDYTIEKNSENQWRYKLRFTYDSTYYFRLVLKFENTILYGNISTFDCTYFSSLSDFDILKDELMGLCRNSLGFLFYPFDLIFTILDRFLNIKFENPQINIPDIYLPFSGQNYKLIDSFTFNFTDYINQNNIFKTIHNFILIGSDFIIIWGVVHLLRKEWEAFFK